MVGILETHQTGILDTDHAVAVGPNNGAAVKLDPSKRRAAAGVGHGQTKRP
jgi:hypothetical protein